MKELVWVACTDCLTRFPEKPWKGCTVCEGSGQYQALRPAYRWETTGPPIDRTAALEWVRDLKAH